MKKAMKTSLNNIVDFHSHILHEIDDGSISIDQSLEMLKIAEQQNVSHVILTPHFYIDEQDAEQFILARNKKYHQLCEANQTSVKLHLGTEVYLLNDLLLLPSIKDLCIEGTNRILLEIPHQAEINTNIFNLINRVASNFNVIPIIAHIDRYFWYTKHHKQVINNLIDLGCELQLNESALLDKKRFREAKHLIQNGYIKYIGSDAHDTIRRKCDISAAYDIIIKKFGVNVAEFLNTNALRILNK